MSWTLEEIELQAARGGVNRQQAVWLIERLTNLEESIRWSCAWWDRTRPDAPAFEVVDHFRRLLEPAQEDDDA